MSLVKDIVGSLIEKGDIIHETTIHGIKFEMRLLSNEEQILADGLVDMQHIRDKYKAEASFTTTFRDTVEKFRAVALVAFSIKSVNGKSPVDKSLSLEEQYKQRVEFRDELLGLPTPIQDKLASEYNQLLTKQTEFLNKAEEIAGK